MFLDGFIWYHRPSIRSIFMAQRRGTLALFMLHSILLRMCVTAGAVASLAVVLLVSPQQIFLHIKEWGTASIFLVESITSEDLRRTYSRAAVSPREAKVRIVIVPGHEPTWGGTEYRGIAERDIVTEIAQALASLLAGNPRYEVPVARSKTAWNPPFETYFIEHESEIHAFRKLQTDLMNQYVRSGLIHTDQVQVEHNVAPSETAFHLYGINRWANENGGDLVLHLHINDYGGRTGLGVHSGLALYVPDAQYSNASASREVAASLLKRLSAYHPVSTLSPESAGII